MKNFIRTLVVAAVLSVSSAFAQSGPVFLNNYDSNNGIYAPGGSLATSFFVQIYAGVDANSLSLITSSGGNPTSTFTALEPGFFDNGFGFTGLPNASTGYFRMVAWQGSSDFNSATASGSVDWTQTVGTQPAGDPLPTAISAPLNNPVLNMTVAVVPEPTTIALGVLGGLGMLARRRRNAA